MVIVIWHTIFQVDSEFARCVTDLQDDSSTITCSSQTRRAIMNNVTKHMTHHTNTNTYPKILEIYLNEDLIYRLPIFLFVAILTKLKRI